MHVSKKVVVAIVLAFAVLSGAFVYSLLQVQHQTVSVEEQGDISSTVVVGEIDVNCYQWVDGEVLGVAKTTHDWGMVLIGGEGEYYSENLVIKNEGDEAVSISFSNDLDPALGMTPTWRIEVSVGAEWRWGIIDDSGVVTWLGQDDNLHSYTLPNLGAGETFGFRHPDPVSADPPTQWELRCFGHVQMVLQYTADPTYGTHCYNHIIHATELP